MGYASTRSTVGVVAIAAIMSLAGCTPSEVAPPTSSPELLGTPAPTENGPCQNTFSAHIELGTDPSAPKTAYLVLTNDGDAPCSLSGFPGEAAYVGESGPIETLGYEGSPTVDEYGRAGEVVAVDPGERAYVWLRISRTSTRGVEDPCEFPSVTKGVTVVLPGASAPVVAATDTEVCLDTDADDLQVGPVDTQPRPASSQL